MRALKVLVTHLISTGFSFQSEQRKIRKKNTRRLWKPRQRKIFLNVNEAFSGSDYGRELNDYNMNRIVYVPIQENYNQSPVVQV